MSRASVLAQNDQEVQDYVLLFKNRPFGPLSPQFGSDDSLVSAAYVKRQGVEYSNLNGVGVSTVLTNANIGSVVSAASATPINITLMSTAGVPNGATIEVVNAGGGGLATVLAAGSDVLTSQGGVAVPVVLGAGDNAYFVKVSGEWRLRGGSIALKYAALFSAVLGAAAASQQLPGLIIKAGNISNSSTAASIPLTFPVSFPNFCVGLVLTPWSTGGNAYSHNGRDKSGATISRGANAAYYFDYIAIGY